MRMIGAIVLRVSWCFLISFIVWQAQELPSLPGFGFDLCDPRHYRFRNRQFRWACWQLTRLSQLREGIADFSVKRTGKSESIQGVKNSKRL